VVWHHSLLLMNSFNKTEAAVFSCRLCFRRAFSFISLILLTTAGFSDCVAAIKGRPVLHHSVVIFFWSSGIMECTCLLFTFENGFPFMLGGVSGYLLLLMNSFNKTEAAVFSCRLCFLWAFSFISLIDNYMYPRVHVHIYKFKIINEY